MNRSQSRESANKKRRVFDINFTIGDFFLVVSVIKGSKLAQKWTGPYEIIGSINDYVFKVKHVLTKEIKDVHSSRIQYYRDSGAGTEVMEVTKSMPTAYQVSKIPDSRTQNGQKQLLVEWVGFEEPSWEPEETIREDVPVLVEQFMKNKGQ